MAAQSKLSEVADEIKLLIEANAVSLELDKVYYGDEQHIPKTPAVSVAPDDKSATIAQTGLFTDNIFRVDIILFFSKLGAPSDTRLAALRKAEEIAFLLDSNPNVADMIHSYVRVVRPVVAKLDRVIHKAVLLQWEGRGRSRQGVADA